MNAIPLFRLIRRGAAGAARTAALGVALTAATAATVACDRGDDLRESLRRREVALKFATRGTAMSPAPSAADSAVSQAQWIAAHALRFGSEENDHRLRRLVDTLLQHIDDRRVVIIGEPSAPFDEHLRLTDALLRALHQRKGFDVLVVEAPMWDCATTINEDLPLDDESLFDACAFPARRTAQARRTFEWIASTHRTARPVALAGMDPGCAPTRTAIRRPSRLAQLADHASAFDADSAFLVHCLAHYDDWRTQRELGTSVALVNRSVSQPTLEHRLRTLAGRLDSASLVLTEDLLRARAMVAARAVRSALTLSRGADLAQSIHRTAMQRRIGENLAFLVDSLYPGRRVVVLAHTREIRGSISTAAEDDYIALGGLLRTLVGTDAVFVLGMLDALSYDALLERLTASRTPLNGVEWDLAMALADSAGAGRYLRIDRPHRIDGNSFLFAKRGVAGTRPGLRPANDFDGLITIVPRRPAQTIPRGDSPRCCPRGRP